MQRARRGRTLASKTAILVTGGAGYIGSHTVLELLAAGETPVVLDDLSTGFQDAVPDGVAFHQGDCGDAALLDELFARHHVGAVIHFAARAVVPDSVADPLGYYDTNTARTLTLIARALHAGIPHVVFSSTSAVYGDAAVIPLDETPLPHPISPYGRSKLMCEWMLQDTARAHPLTFAALRYFNVAGADPLGRTGQSTARATHLIKVAVQAALGLRDGLDVYGTDYPTPDGSCVRDYIHVSDLARAHLDALRYLRDGGASLICNVGYGRGYSVLEVIETVKRVSGVDFPVRRTGRRAGDPATVIAANTLVRERLGWTPRHADLEAIVRDALAWERRLAKSR
jgi:UDP-glucose 4-epimerase